MKGIRTMSEATLQVGKILTEIRKQRKLSLDDLSQITGVSKPMLGQIERGKSVPTITTLWKIATGLKVPLSVFLEPPKLSYMLASPRAETCVTEEDGMMQAWPLFIYDPIHSMESFLIELQPGCQHDSSPHSSGVEEMVLLIEGDLTMKIGDQPVLMSRHQEIRFRADQEHSYTNMGESPCLFYNAIFYPDPERSFKCLN